MHDPLLLPVEAGAFDDDPAGREDLVRAAIREAIAARRPIFPRRALGLEYAAVSNGPRGLPVAEVALANLRVGESFPLAGKTYRVRAVGRSIIFTVEPEGRVVRISPDSRSWESLVRDVDGIFLGAAHGCDAGDLPAAWARDPFARYPAPRIPATPLGGCPI